MFLSVMKETMTLMGPDRTFHFFPLSSNIGIVLWCRERPRVIWWVWWGMGNSKFCWGVYVLLFRTFDALPLNPPERSFLCLLISPRVYKLKLNIFGILALVRVNISNSCLVKDCFQTKEKYLPYLKGNL